VPCKPHYSRYAAATGISKERPLGRPQTIYLQALPPLGASGKAVWLHRRRPTSEGVAHDARGGAPRCRSPCFTGSEPGAAHGAAALAAKFHVHMKPAPHWGVGVPPCRVSEPITHRARGPAHRLNDLTLAHAVQFVASGLTAVTPTSSSLGPR
jgi:hypothetical protein